MPSLAEQSVRRLHAAGVQLDRGMSDRELSRIEDRFHIAFGPEHREFLKFALPVGKPWPDWRNGSTDDLQVHLDWPIDGVIFDVHHNGFWPSSWGERPTGRADRERRARGYLDRVPRLIPVHSHRYLTVDREYVPSPVFSVHQTDVIYYGDNLLDYVAYEWRVPPLHPSAARPHVPFWSELAENVDADDM